MVYILLGLFVFFLLVGVLVRLGKTSGEIEVLKVRIAALEKHLKELVAKPPPEDTAQAEPTQKVTVAPESEAAPPSIPVQGQPAVAPPPIPRLPAEDKSVAPVEAPPKIPEAKGFDLVNFLRGIGLWPPEQKDGSSELVFMQWWTPRIGGALAILAIIFFAVYVAQGTPPWVKFTEMLATSGGVFGLGLYLSKKRPALGKVLVATGLSMIYISSVAGYAVGPVKIVDNPIIGAIMQLAALVLNFGMGSWRKDRGILILALIFGYISALFAALEGFREAALISALFVYVAGLVSYRKIGGLALMSLSLAGVYLPLLGFVAIEAVKDAAVYPHFWSVIVFLAITVSLLPACKIFFKEPAFLDAKWNRLFQSLNTSLAIGLGFFFAANFYPLSKTEFYGILALLFVAWSLVWYARDKQGIEFHLFFLKGSALASLWFINYYHGDLRWMALGLQVLILTNSVHRSKSFWLEIIAGLTWLVSFGYFVQTDFNESTGSFLWFLQGLYLLVSVGGLGYLMAYTSNQPILRRFIYGFVAVLVAGASAVFAASSDIKVVDEPANLAIMALLVFAISIPKLIKAWVPLIVGSLLFVSSNFFFWFEPAGYKTLLVILAVTAVCLIGLMRAKVARHNVIETIIHGLWVLTVLVFLNTYQVHYWYPVVIALFALLLFLGGYSPLRRLPEVCALPIFYFLFRLGRNEFSDTWLYLYLLILAVLANLGVSRVQFRKFTHFLKGSDLLWWILNGMFIISAYKIFENTVTSATELFLWTGLGFLYFALWNWRGRWVSFFASLFCGYVPVMKIMDLWLNPMPGGLMSGAPWAWQVLLAGLLSVALWLTVGGYTHIKPNPKMSEGGLTFLAWMSGILAFVVYAAAFDYPLLSWERLYTPFLAAFSIGLIILGISLKSRPFRYVAMISFLVPLFRLFVFDIRETLYRIIAFAVLAAILTFVGFLYQKFSSRIE